MRAIGLGGMPGQRNYTHYTQHALPQVLVFDEKLSLDITGDTDLEARAKFLEEVQLQNFSTRQGSTFNCATCVEAFDAWMTACEETAEGIATLTAFESKIQFKQLVKMSHEGIDYSMLDWGTEHRWGTRAIRESGALSSCRAACDSRICREVSSSLARLQSTSRSSTLPLPR